MGKITKAPTYLDATSQLSDTQIKKINSMIKSQVNLFTSRAVQKQMTDKLEDVISASSPRIITSTGYKFHDVFFICGSMDISGLEEGSSTDILEISEDPESLSLIGYFDSNLKLPVSAYGTFNISNRVVSLQLETVPDSNILFFNIKGKIKEE